jgi:1-acyl-sn-glycerol-3-phosphate acyltransferase
MTLLFMSFWIFEMAALFYLYSSLHWSLIIVLSVINIPLSFAFNIFFFGVIIHLYGKSFKEADWHNLKAQKAVVTYMKTIVFLLRYKLYFSGLENIPQDRAFIIVGNHQTNYDTIIHKMKLPLKTIFIAKYAIFSWPIIGPIGTAAGNIPMLRENDREAIKALKKGIQAYQEGVNVGIYPEGTRSKGNHLLEFKAGAFNLAMKPKAPILLVTVHNTIKTWKGWPFKRPHVSIHYHPIIEPSFYEGMSTHELSDYAKSEISKQLETFKSRVK